MLNLAPRLWWSVTVRSVLGVLSAKQMGAKRIIAMSRRASRQKLAREFGAADIVTERGDEGITRIKELTNGIGADSVLECVGTQESMMRFAIALPTES
jgi:threonine dehydrogenase-like Zn-dependent dehydrogenase